MTPVRLQLKNFMSYGEGVPPLEFSGMRLACLCGDNGAGKTTLLDALTWALWGETRAKAEDDVIRLGASDCGVLFDFSVDGQLYRVDRRRNRRGGAIWELSIWQSDGTKRALSGTSANETKKRIEALLRMDYKTFLASAYLAQGRADEFTRASVADRKKVLADILDLSRYERLEQMAKDHRAEADQRLVDAERSIATIDSELEHEDEHRNALDTAEARLKVIVGEMEALQKDQELLTLRCERLEQMDEQAREWEARAVEVREDIARSEELLHETEVRIGVARQILDRRAEIETAYAAAQKVRGRIAVLEARDNEARALEREAHALERTIEEERVRLDNERYRLQCEAENIEREAADITSLDAEIARLDASIAEYADPEARRREIEQNRTQADEEFIGLKTERARLDHQIAQFTKRIEALSSSNASLCDYCGQPLKPEKRRQAREEAEQAKTQCEADLKGVITSGKQLNALREQLKQYAEQAQADLRTVGNLQARKAQAEQQRNRLEERRKDLPKVRERLTRFAQALADRDYVPEAQERLMKVSARLEKLERVAQELADARAEGQRLASAEREFAQLENAEAVVKDETRRVEQIKEHIVREEAKIKRAEAKIAEFRQKTEALPGLRRDLEAVTASLLSARAEERAARAEIAQKTLLLERCARLREERARRVEEQQAAAKDKQIYTELVAAFGKKGVQALIIENALPEIQDVANEILGRMTDGAMQVQLITQREARSSRASTIETLEIIISDEMGTRPYEMFSGGEAYRINFALRIALSKLLARRAGAPLQTLILDEGFGTQDPRGREAIADAIHAVSDDFSLILVITHIDELKDQFPTRIEVTKGPSGSTFAVA